ncbi:MAG: lipid-A-disaccharide synthase-related protein [Leptolyngbyaceae cyanobacterium MO_188.B28]|nr:lipid-A-disaccharide synthase-related protein [Leptolyngbyaceae cyanobacterium MO_188.B28]
MKLLCISNGHGEDVIAGRILDAIRQHPAAPDICALPMVGSGHIYAKLGVPVIGPTKKMPSGGFIYMDSRQLARDIKGGLLQLTLAQFRAVRAWARSGGAILAVGDLVPLLFAWFSGAKYAFVGTAKSDYYFRDEIGPLPKLSGWQRLQSRVGSIYYPWERWLMSRRRCKTVFVRDELTTERLLRWPIPAIYAGNPMMDGLAPSAAGLSLSILDPPEEDEEPLTVVLLPGSREPEAYENWERMLTVVSGLIQTFRQRRVLLLAAIAPGLDLNIFQKPLKNQGWLPKTTAQPTDADISDAVPAQAPLKYPIFTDRNATLALIQDAYADCLHQAHFAIAMAGTATEQFVGLGKPAITLAGQGPQFTPAFAQAQARHLGSSVILAQRPADVATAMESLLVDPDRLQLIQENGRRRMGTPGAANRIADILMERF